ncbi:nucleotidyltransferase family protein [Vibrio owensii]|uniref:nucleotidyltransferase family protein n=1 Tax=Vibrio owensii TaxID=696485 RepID=UPI00215CCF61|nr:nucleotidyltransferase family protein [Vibrio owensii]MCR9940395.1 nucleotidyltransferase family protein [Vibrio owensii]
MEDLVQLLLADHERMKAMECARSLALPDCYIAAGFVRNLVWDHLHQKQNPTPLNDLDVVYFDPDELDEQAYLKYETQLNALMPEFNWQVRNQANMHIRNGDNPYQSTLDAMSYWPEKETAVAARLNEKNQIDCISAFGFESLFEARITYNPKRTLALFQSRVESKNWLITWPQLQVAV